MAEKAESRQPELNDEELKKEALLGRKRNLRAFYRNLGKNDMKRALIHLELAGVCEIYVAKPSLLRDVLERNKEAGPLVDQLLGVSRKNIANGDCSNQLREASYKANEIARFKDTGQVYFG